MNVAPILAVLTLASSVAIIALILLGLRKALVGRFNDFERGRLGRGI
jgi:hypothetical protein